MKYSHILFTLPLIVILHITKVTCDCKEENEDFEKTINCTGVTIKNVEIRLTSLLQPSHGDTYKKSTTIIIKDSNTPVISRNLFDSLALVEKLYLINNNITGIIPYSFSMVPELQELNITNNSELNYIIKNTFIGLSNLKILNLSHNNLTSLENVNNLIRLEELNVANNNLFKLKADSFERMPRLKVLNLSKNKLTTLEYINQIHTLEILNVSFNLIESVTRYDFQLLESLEILDLSQNLLRNLAPGLFTKSHKLNYLNLRNNSIKTFYSDLFYKSISHVDLSMNLMHSIQCEQIQGSIVLANNYIDHICHFGQNITSIDFSECDLPTVEKQAFKHLHNVEFLNLTRNFITTVHVDAFEDLNNLRYLSISDNEISILEVGTFHQLIFLEKLDISKNFIEKLEHGIFTALHQLTSLDISHNKLQTIDSSIFFAMKNLENLYLENNPLIVFDTSALTDHLTSLSMLSIHYEEIGCDALESKLNMLNSEQVTVKPGKNIKGHNVNGIPCNPDILNESNRRINRGKEAKQYLIFFEAFGAVFILITVSFIILITMHFVSWYRKYFNGCKRNNFKNNESSCSVTLLTENGHD